MECLGATNIRLRWSRGGYEIASALQTFGSAGAGEDMKLPPRYNHSAPLEPRRIWNCLSATNIRLRWSRGGYGMPPRYKHSAPLEPRRIWNCLSATNIRLRWSRGGYGMPPRLTTGHRPLATWPLLLGFAKRVWG